MINQPEVGHVLTLAHAMTTCNAALVEVPSLNIQRPSFRETRRHRRLQKTAATDGEMRGSDGCTYNGVSGAPWRSQSGQSRSVIASAGHEDHVVFRHGFREDVAHASANALQRATAPGNPPAIWHRRRLAVAVVHQIALQLHDANHLQGHVGRRRPAALTARTRAGPVSMEPNRVSPIFMATTCAPGATPFFSGSFGKKPAAMLATWVPWEPASSQVGVAMATATHLRW